MSSYEIAFEVPILGTDDAVEIICEFSVISWGSPASWDDPGSGPEWDIDRIWIGEEEILYFRALGYAGSLWQVLAEACDYYINENFDFDNNFPDWED